MIDSTAAPRTLDELRAEVHRRLCAREDLLEDQFELTEMPLARRGRPCGMQFCLHGPRSVRLGAVWAADHNVLYLYDARGQRYEKVKLALRLNGFPTASTPSSTLADAA